ncbi:MAG: hypothetical protein O6922_07965 [Chloroflexi bacterium]|nr:hypothetical protein [Chloroflexota bacterium]
MTFANHCARVLCVCGLGLALEFAIGCGGNPLGGSSASVFPSSLSLDISDFPDDTTNADARAVIGGEVAHIDSARIFNGAFERPCRAIGALLHGFHRLLDRGMALAALINNDLTDPDDPHVQGTLPAGGQSWTYKADFSAFDIDGDNTVDGSGRFDTDPVAVRVWIVKDTGAERFFCALITTRPTTDHAGAGQLYLQPGVIHPLVNADFTTYSMWDRTDAANRWTEAYTVGRLRQNIHAPAGHHKIELLTLADGSVQKTVRSTSTIDNSDFDISEIKVAGRTIRGTNLGLLNVEIVGTPTVTITGQCISLIDCSASAAADCSSIDTAGMDFLDPAVGGETDWPADFPETPTF